MSSLMIIYLLGCATTFVQAVSYIYIEYKKERRDIVVNDIFQVVCATFASWAFLTACIISNYPKLWNKVVYKSKQEKE